MKVWDSHSWLSAFGANDRRVHNPDSQEWLSYKDRRPNSWAAWTEKSLL
jgi:hypothetical protein